MSKLPEVKVPVGCTDTDIARETRDYLKNLSLLPDEQALADADGPGAAFGGPPQSVALIEAGATAMAKWWAAGLGAAVAGAWGSVRVFWNTYEEQQAVMLWCAAIVSAALILALGALLSSDVRARGDASVATIRARAELGSAMLELTKEGVARATASVSAFGEVTTLTPLLAKNLAGHDSGGWTAIAMHQRRSTGEVEYLLVKGPLKEWVASADVEFLPLPPSIVVGMSA